MGCWVEAAKEQEMSALARFASSFLAAATIVIASAGCTSTPPASPRLLARCTQFYVLWFRYEQHITFHHTGQQAQAELALNDCQQGRYDAGLQQLEKMLRRGRVPIPT
jgi:hypothetical protein